jgi:hypothetical protein
MISESVPSSVSLVDFSKQPPPLPNEILHTPLFAMHLLLITSFPLRSKESGYNYHCVYLYTLMGHARFLFIPSLSLYCKCDSLNLQTATVEHFL